MEDDIDKRSESSKGDKRWWNEEAGEVIARKIRVKSNA